MICFDSHALLPDAWGEQSQTGEAHVFNPALTSFRGRFLLAYRIVLSDGRRRLAICWLNADLQVVRGSVVPLSDFITNAGSWHADARFCALDDKLFLHFNDGARTPNHIFLVELHPTTLLPLGPAKPLILRGSRQLVEKNWMLFSHEGQLHAVYRIAPHTILRVLDAGEVMFCVPFEPVRWDAGLYARRFGPLRGGTPPIAVGDRYFSFFHSVQSLSGFDRFLNRIRGGRSRRYVAGFYAFAAWPPFAPVGFTPMPVLRAPASTMPPVFTPQFDRVIYPCGAVFDDGRWTVSYGVNNEQCCLEVLSHAELLSQMVEILPTAVA